LTGWLAAAEAGGVCCCRCWIYAKGHHCCWHHYTFLLLPGIRIVQLSAANEDRNEKSCRGHIDLV